MLILFQLGDLVNHVLQFDFEVIYKTDNTNIEAHCSSRNHVSKTNEGVSGNKIHLLNFLLLKKLTVIRVDFFTIDTIRKLKDNRNIV